MICPLEDQVLRLGAGPVPEGRRLALLRHAEGCPRCGRALDTLAAAREVLTRDRRAPDPGARVRVWAGIESAQRRRPSPLPLWGFAAVVVAAVALFSLDRFPVDRGAAPHLERGRLRVDGAVVEPGRGLPSRTELVADGPARIVTAAAELELASGTVLRLLPHGEGVAVDLAAGELSVSLAEEATEALVFTQAVRVTVLSGRATLRAEGAHATVWVAGGRVWAEVPGAAVPERLEAGAERSYGARTGPGARPDAPPGPAPSAALPPAIPQPRAPEPRDHARSLAAARAALPAAPTRARAIAAEVLDRRPGARLEVEALALIADAERRSGRLRDALRSYGRVVDHRRGEPYAEEALFRQATLHAQLGEPRDALAKLEAGELRFAGGALAPERAALEARLHVSAGRPEAAARALERVSEAARSLAIARQRVEVAEALRGADPARAARLAAPALDAPDPEIRRRAELLFPAGEPTRGAARAGSDAEPKTE